MSDWLHELPVVWLALVVFAGMALIGAVIFFAVLRVAVGDRGAALKGLSPGMLSPMGIVFALMVASSPAECGAMPIVPSRPSTPRRARCGPSCC
jgi:hypothetical protein